MKHLAATLTRLEHARDRVLAELHPELLRRVRLIYIELGGRLTPYCGYRGPLEQASAKESGASHAAFGDSPHNFKPALACDLVLHPSLVRVRERPDAPGFVDLWDPVSPEAVDAWFDLEEAAKRHGLERVNVNGKRDKPHVQLPAWRSYLKV